LQSDPLTSLFLNRPKHKFVPKLPQPLIFSKKAIPTDHVNQPMTPTKAAVTPRIPKRPPPIPPLRNASLANNNNSAITKKEPAFEKEYTSEKVETDETNNLDQKVSHFIWRLSNRPPIEELLKRGIVVGTGEQSSTLKSTSMSNVVGSSTLQPTTLPTSTPTNG